ncbi:PHD finger protein [Senna tora]|uniref:PHD finger protein n=1 Tax=Senna tora TaxID=362788 RepID=A0A834T6F1_9FABA|nr:PHD finger protein [Senna tora]
MEDSAMAPEVKDSAEEAKSEGLPVKRPVENGGGEELVKKPKVEAAASSGELKRVAEIVLVLSTMATMRGGRKPADVEIELMKEARAKLVELCQGLAPKDIVAREAIGTVIEDLGLNGKIKDQRLGFQPPKMSIAERFSLTKLKIEESKKFSARSATYTSQPLQTSISGTVESRGQPHAVRMFPADKSSHAVISSAGTPASMPVTHVSAGSSAALQHQSTSNEVRPSIVSSGVPSSHLGRNSSSSALPKAEPPHFKVDGGSNASSYVLQVQANTSANQPLVNAPTWSIQTQSASLAKSAPEDKVPGQNTVKPEGTGDQSVSRAAQNVARDQSFRPFVTQTGPGNVSSMHQPMQGMNIVQPPALANNHIEVAKIVQKLLQPKLPEHPTWTPPSRDYMNKALTCQMCELTVSEVDSVLLCDACEKGFHLKCLQPSILRGIPRGEWHCMRCLTLSGGKPLPPKYGRVMRSSNTPPKLPSSSGGIQPSLEKKAGVLEPKVSSQKLTTNGSPVSTDATGINKIAKLPSDSKTPDTKETQDNTSSSSSKHMDEKPDPNISIKSFSAANSSSVMPVESSAEQTSCEASTCKDSAPASELATLPKLSDSVKINNSQFSQNLQVDQTVLQDNAEVPLNKCIDNSLKDNSKKESNGGESLTYDMKCDERYVALANSDQNSGTNTEGRQHTALYSDGSHAVEWIGDLIKLVDEKKFYQSCCVDGVTYRLHDHILFPSSHGKLTPSKLQSMWEDSKTGLKWVQVTNCYFPGDLPGNIAHPCISEVNEVYESNSARTEMAGSIRDGSMMNTKSYFSQLPVEAVLDMAIPWFVLCSLQTLLEFESV